jgi:shikimate kinase
MLWGEDKLEKIRTLLAQRAPAYRKADLIVDTTAKTIEEVTQHILKLLGPDTNVTQLRQNNRKFRKLEKRE